MTGDRLDHQRPDINTGPIWLHPEMKGDSDLHTCMTLAHPPDTQTGCSVAGSTGPVKACWVLEGRKRQMTQWWLVATNKAVVTVTSLR